MLRRRITGALATGMAISCLISCSGSVDVPNIGNGNGGATSSSSSSSSGTGGMSSGGAGGAGGKSFCADAKPIEPGEPVLGDLAITGQKDLYRFTGKKGQVLGIDVDAQYLGNAAYDPTYIDSVVTLFDDQGNEIARNDNPLEYRIDDSRLYTILPEDGEYCVQVSECWTTIYNPELHCAGTADKLVTSYVAYLDEFVDLPDDGVTAEIEMGDNAENAKAIEFEELDASWYLATYWGTFRDESDVDVFSFMLPAGISVPPDRRSEGRIYIMPTGSTGSGSTATMGNMWIAEANNPEKKLAQVDAYRQPKFVPILESDKQYLLFVDRPATVTAANDFYFVRHYIWYSNPLEKETGTGQNDTPTTAEPIAINGATFRGYIAGDLFPNGPDIDQFKASVPPGNGLKYVGAICGARVNGSSLRDMKLTLRASDGALLDVGASSIEKINDYAYVEGVPIGNNNEIILEVAASKIDPTIAQTYYSCSIHFDP